jgi:hypothetical protein
MAQMAKMVGTAEEEMVEMVEMAEMVTNKTHTTRVRQLDIMAVVEEEEVGAAVEMRGEVQPKDTLSILMEKMDRQGILTIRRLPHNVVRM